MQRSSNCPDVFSTSRTIDSPSIFRTCSSSFRSCSRLGRKSRYAPGFLISIVCLLAAGRGLLSGIGFKIGFRVRSGDGVLTTDLRWRERTSAIGSNGATAAARDGSHSWGGGSGGGRNRTSGRMAISGDSADLLNVSRVKEDQETTLTSWLIEANALKHR